MCIICGVDCKGGEFIGNKQTNSLTHVHTDAQLYVLVQMFIICCVNEEGCGSNVDMPWIREHYTFLVDELKSLELIIYLYEMKVIDRTEMENVSAERTSNEQNKRLLSILERKSHEKIQQFFMALDKTGQSHIRNHVLGRQAGIAQNMTLILFINLSGKMDRVRAVYYCIFFTSRRYA